MPDEDELEKQLWTMPWDADVMTKKEEEGEKNDHMAGL
jgi:hypothetical protein